MGHEDAFPRPRPSARCRFSQETFAGTRGKGQGAPIPDLPAPAIEWESSTSSRTLGPAQRFLQRTDFPAAQQVLLLF